MSRLWIAFLPYTFASILHVWALAMDLPEVASPTKLMLMPFLALGVVWAGNREWTPAHSLLVTAIAVSWIGDGAGPLFPGAEVVPVMLLFFALTQVCYIWLFWRVLAVRRLPLWTIVYAIWWVGLLVLFWPVLGSLLVPVALYGLLLAATATGAARCHRLIRWGGAFFLVADTVLAFELFMPGILPAWSSPLVMATYCLSQGLIAAGVVVEMRARSSVGERASVPWRALA